MKTIMRALCALSVLAIVGCDDGGGKSAADQIVGPDAHIYTMSSVDPGHYTWTMMDGTARVCPVCRRDSMYWSQARPVSAKLGADMFLLHCYECKRSFYDMTEPNVAPVTNAAPAAIAGE